MWLHTHELVPPFVLALLCYLIGGWPGLIVGLAKGLKPPVTARSLHRNHRQVRFLSDPDFQTPGPGPQTILALFDELLAPDQFHS